jgi:hypothetical protein
MLCVLGSVLAPRQLLAAALEPWLESEVAYQAPVFGTARYASLGAGLALVIRPGVEAGAGARLLLGGLEQRPGVAAYTGVRLCAAAGAWRPALGVEVELASSLRASPSADEISGSLESQFRSGDSPLLRAGMVVAPLRFRVERLVISFAALRLATPVDASAGDRLYVGLALVNAGWAL